MRMPAAVSGPSKPTSCSAPRHSCDARVAANASAPPTAQPADASTAALGEATAATPATTTGAVITDTSNTIATSA